MSELPLAITAIYVALTGFLVLVLAALVVRQRQRKWITILNSDDPDLLRALRAHGNAVEYVPLGLIVLAVLEINGMPAVALHGFGISLLVSRFLHAFAFSQTRFDIPLRIIGTAGTILTLTLGIIVLLAQVAGVPGL